MKLQPLTVHRPTSVAEAVDTRSNIGEDSIFYAGGTELLLVMKLGFADHSHLIDLKHVDSLREISVQDEDVRIGATATYQTIIRNMELNRRFPALVKMLTRVGNLRVRTTGTLGGNLAFADPHSDPLTFLIAAKGFVDVAATDGTNRSIPVDQFAYGPYMTAMGQGEVLTSIRVPIPSIGTRISHVHVRFRERPALTVTASAEVSERSLRDLALVVGSIEAVPRQIDVDGILGPKGRYEMAEIQDLVRETVEPMEDLDGSSSYKSHLAGVFAWRAIQDLLDFDGLGEQVAT